MTNAKQYHLINKGIQLEIIKPTIQINLTKTEMSAIINEALQDEAANASIKRILNPFLTESFPQFPEFNAITLGETAEDGSTVVTLKKRVEKSATTDQPVDDAVESEPEEAEFPDEVHGN